MGPRRAPAARRRPGRPTVSTPTSGGRSGSAATQISCITRFSIAGLPANKETDLVSVKKPTLLATNFGERRA